MQPKFFSLYVCKLVFEQSVIHFIVTKVFPCREMTSLTLSFCVFTYFQGLRDSMRQAELNNWSLEPTQIADLCSSINQFFARTGVIPPLGAVQPPVCHGSMHPSKPSQHLNTGKPPSPSSPFCWISIALVRFFWSDSFHSLTCVMVTVTMECLCIDDFSLILNVSKNKHTSALSDECSSFTFPPV